MTAEQIQPAGTSEGCRNPIIGGGGGLVYPQIKSPNFNLAAKTGWAILKNGNAYFFGLVTTIGQQLVFINSNTFTGSAAYLYASPAVGTAGQSTLFLVGPTDNHLQAILQLVGESNDGTKQPYASLYQFDLNTNLPSGGVPFALNNVTVLPSALAGAAMLYATGQYLAVAGNGYLGKTTAIHPGTTATPETWQTITLDAGWSASAGYATPSYRMLPDGNLQLTGQADAGTAQTANKTLNNSNPLPAAYRPVTSKLFRSFTGFGNRGEVQIDPSGIITMHANATYPARYCEIDAVLPLNL